jgi:hypothetical protein
LEDFAGEPVCDPPVASNFQLDLYIPSAPDGMVAFA